MSEPTTQELGRRVSTAYDFLDRDYRKIRQLERMVESHEVVIDRLLELLGITAENLGLDADTDEHEA